ncbi:MAG: T9SS type B sorting domain-containing protein [Chitinophagaceae bacterium]|nr:MAG: T9SS type B sorting domain-containing protein [Chitinophagaceae bacterium]
MSTCQRRILLSIFIALLFLFSLPAIAQVGSGKQLPDSILFKSSLNTPVSQQAKNNNSNNYTIFKAAQNRPSEKINYKGPNCFSNLTRVRFTEDSFHISNNKIIKSSDGNILISGARLKSYTPYVQIGYLVKCTPEGDTLWVKNLESSASSQFLYSTNIFELADGSLILVSRIYVSLPINYREDMVLTKLSAQGDFIWQKTFVSPLWVGGIGNFEINDLKEDEAGDMILCGGVIMSSFSRYGLIARLTSQGEIVWSKGFQQADGLPVFVGFSLKDQTIEAYGRISTELLGVAIVDKQTGALVTARAWRTSLPYPAAIYDFFNPYGQVLLNNGNTMLYGRASADLAGSGNVAHWATLELNRSWEPVAAYLYKNDLASNFYDTRMMADKDGTVLFSLSTFDASTSAVNILAGKSKNGKLLRERMIPFPGDHPHDFSNFVRLNDGSEMIASSINASNDYTLTSINLLTINNSDTASACAGFDTSLTTIVPMEWNSYPLSLTSSENSLMEIAHEIYYPVNDGFHIVNGCRQESYCDTFGLRLEQDTICLSDQALLHLTKNIECGARVEWNDEPAIQTFQYITDSLVALKFSAPWEGFILGEINGCETLRDSVKLTVLAIPPSLELGPDRKICNESPITINAKIGFTSYLWNDGSTDSLLIVNQPGKYYVDVSDACGNAYTDTVQVHFEQIDFSLGEDKLKCNKDTLVLTAPAGFDSYDWGPDYHISSSSLSTVSVFPDIDTVYFVRAQRDIDCFVQDTVRVNVHHSPAIDLGTDKPLCKGDTLLLDAGPGFVVYQWSNGVNSQRLSVYDEGDYSIVATDASNCISTDTFKVISLWEKPVPFLKKDNWLCEGQERVLDPGSFASYLWQNGSSQFNFTVNSFGTYHVTVKDEHACIGSDTVIIDLYKTLPKDFLPADTVICAGTRISLSPDNGFHKYLWNDGSINFSNAVSKPGFYWLEVEDQYGCTGRDTILIGQAQNCVTKIWVPTAFSPNNDGRNDILLPAVSGPVFDYTFSVFNRWGEVVFFTRDPLKGWDGSYKGNPQDTNVFIWVCAYRERQSTPMIEQKGSFTLIR